jgi:hypothetical protein
MEPGQPDPRPSEPGQPGPDDTGARDAQAQGAIPTAISPQDDALTRSVTIAWEVFRRAWPLLLVATLALILANVPGMIVNQLAQFGQNLLTTRGAGLPAYIMLWAPVVLVNIVLGVALQWPIQTGAMLAAIQASRGGTSDFGAIVAPFRRLVPLALATVLVALLSMLAVLPGLALTGIAALVMFGRAGGAPSATGVGVMILGVILASAAGLWMSARLLPALPRTVDPVLPRLGPVDSVRAAWRATRGHAMVGIGIQLLAGAIVFLSVFCCCVGVLLFGVPAYLALIAGFYRTMFAAAEDEVAPPPPAPAWTGRTPPQSPI